jgi:hypothetical protein
VEADPAYLIQFATCGTCESLPHWFDGINESLQHQDVVDGLFRMLKIEFGRQDHKLCVLA